MIKLTKKIINAQIIPHLSKEKRGNKCRGGWWRVVRAKLKTGMQWWELPMTEFFSKHQYRWKTAFYYFSKWPKDGS